MVCLKACTLAVSVAVTGGGGGVEDESAGAWTFLPPVSHIISTATPIMTSDCVFFGITPFGLGALSSIVFGGFGIFSGLSGIAGAPSLRRHIFLRRVGRLGPLRQPVKERLGLTGLFTRGQQILHNLPLDPVPGDRFPLLRAHHELPPCRSRRLNATFCLPITRYPWFTTSGMM